MKFPISHRSLWALLGICVIAAILFLLQALSNHSPIVGAQTNTSLWQDVSTAQMDAITGERQITTVSSRALRLDRVTLATTLSKAPFENSPEATTSPLEIAIPYPDGSFKTFRLVESPIMEPDLAAKFPEIKTYLGKSTQDATATARFDLTPKGFHAMILSDKPTIFIDPPIKGNADFYISYYKSDLRKADWRWECNYEQDKTPLTVPTNLPHLVSNGATLRTYRLALAATGEYTAFHGGTVNGAMAAIATSMNRVNAVYERDLSVRMVLIANNNLIVYTNSATDPYTNNSGSTMLGQNQTNLDTVIGSANYDIGHVFSTGGGGVASLRSVCTTTSKARGVTGSGAPVGDAFDIDYVAHEIGHQFGGNHTFNGTTSSCSGNRSSSAAYEPGSGTTIMAYAGICGAEDLQPHSDDHFNIKSLEEISAFISGATGNSCAVGTATGNTLPTISAGSAYTIPAQTPFTLTATGSDPDAGQTLTYCWEQYNLGTASPPNTDDGTRPIFRSFSPTTSPSRTFPKLSDILNNTSTIGESLPTTSRTLTFQVTARDNRTGGGAANSASVNIETVNTAGPFVVTSPNTATTWGGGSAQVVTWNVANTSASPINCANVKISLSTDGGQTFPTVLLASTPNTGTANVTVPTVQTTQARIKVEAVGNIFFDLSNVNFTITGSCNPITLSPTSLPNGNVGTLYSAQTITASGGTGSYSFGLVGGSLPTGLNLTTGGVISGTPTAHGVFSFTVNATDAGGCTGTRVYTMNITGGGTLSANPLPVPLCNGAMTGTTTLSWTAPSGVTSTEIRRDSLAGTVIGTGGASGSVSSGNIVINGMQFFLINTTGGANLQLASLTATTTTNCALTLSPTSRTIAAAAVNSSVTITTTAGVPWTASSNAAWLTLTAPVTGTGSGTLQYAVAANSGATRTATVTVNDQTHTVVQATSDTVQDSDGDGIPDSVEITEGTNLLLKDNNLFANTAQGYRLFVMQQYRDFLGREGDALGITNWVNLLGSNTLTRATVIESFFNSPEFQGTVPPVVRLYFAAFSRIPDYDGLKHWVNVYRAGTPLETIAQSFATSPEFLTTYGALDNTQFVTLLYNNVLGRAPDQAGLAAWVGLLNGGTTRGAVLLGFSESAEFLNTSNNKVFVTLLYAAMLRRSPDTTGLSTWVVYLNANNSRTSAIQGFLDSTEYHNRLLP